MEAILITPRPKKQKIAARPSLSLKKALLLLSVIVLLTVCGGVEETSKPKPKAWHVSTLAGGASGSGLDGVGTAVSFVQPYGLALSGDTIYVSDFGFNNIRTVNTTTARVVTIVGSNDILSVLTPGYRDGAGTSALLHFPSGIVVKAGSTLYIADINNHRIRAVDLTSANKTVSTIAGSGTRGSSDIGSSGTTAERSAIFGSIALKTGACGSLSRLARSLA